MKSHGRLRDGRRRDSLPKLRVAMIADREANQT